MCVHERRDARPLITLHYFMRLIVHWRKLQNHRKINIVNVIDQVTSKSEIAIKNKPATKTATCQTDVTLNGTYIQWRMQTLTSFQHCGLCPFVPQTKRLSWNFSMTVMTFSQEPCKHRGYYYPVITQNWFYISFRLLEQSFLWTNLLALLVSRCFQSKFLQGTAICRQINLSFHLRIVLNETL